MAGLTPEQTIAERPAVRSLPLAYVGEPSSSSQRPDAARTKAESHSLKAVLRKLLQASRATSSAVEYMAAQRVCDSLMLAFPVQEAAAARAALRIEAASDALQGSDALTALEAALADAVLLPHTDPRRPTLESACRRAFVQHLPRGRSHEACEHYDALVRIEEANVVDETPMDILQRILDDSDESGTSPDPNAPPTTATPRSRRRVRPRKAKKPPKAAKGVLARAVRSGPQRPAAVRAKDVSPPAELQVDLGVAVVAAPVNMASRARPSRLLFVCAGRRDSLLSAAAALLLSRHVGGSDCGQVRIDWVVSDAAMAGPMWDAHALLCAALRHRYGITVGAFDEARAFDAHRDLRADTMIIAMDVASSSRVHASQQVLIDAPEAEAARVDGCAARVPTVGSVHSIVPFVPTYLPATDEQTQFISALKVAERHSRKYARGLVQWQSEQYAERGHAEFARAPPPPPISEPHVALVRMLDRGVVQLMCAELLQRAHATHGSTHGHTMDVEQTPLASSTTNLTTTTDPAVTTDLATTTATARLATTTATTDLATTAPLDRPSIHVAAPPPAATNPAKAARQQRERKEAQSRMEIEASAAAARNIYNEKAAAEWRHLERVLDDIGLAKHAPAFASQQLTVAHLPTLSQEELKVTLGLGWGARQRLAAHLQQQRQQQTGDGDALEQLMTLHGLDEVPPALMSCLRRAGVVNPLRLWAANESAMADAHVPIAARRAVLQAGAATRELALLVTELGLGAAVLVEWVRRGIGIGTLVDMSAAELRAVGLPDHAIRRMQQWLEQGEADAARPGHVGTPLGLVRHLAPFHGGAGGKTVELDGDLNVLLAREAPLVGAKLNAQLAVHRARQDPRWAGYVHF